MAFASQSLHWSWQRKPSLTVFKPLFSTMPALPKCYTRSRSVKFVVTYARETHVDAVEHGALRHNLLRLLANVVVRSSINDSLVCGDDFLYSNPLVYSERGMRRPPSRGHQRLRAMQKFARWSLTCLPLCFTVHLNINLK